MLTENRAEKFDGVGIPKKRRSLDLKSLYSSDKNCKTKNNKRKNRLESGNNVNKKINKLKSCSDLEGHVNKKSRKCVDAELSKKLNCVGVSLDGEGLRIPKGKRAQRRKFVGGVRVELPAGVSGSKVDLVKICVEERDKLVGNSSVHLGNGNCNAEESAATAVSPKFKEQKGNDDQKENKSCSSSSPKFLEQKGSDCHKENKSHRSHSCDAKVKDENPTVHANGSSSVKKEGQKQNRRKNSAVRRSSSVDEAEPSVGQVIRRKNGAVADDEDKLEQNAARMLSSRFDPSCTGFSLETKVDITLSENGLSPMMSSGLDVVSHHCGCLGGSDSTSADGTVRILRPRKDLEGKSLSRKRRHFYEMFAQDFDPYWVLNRRIKVFWPLDKSWYYGLVKAYDPERKQHHVKYDDRDEEWINLENERFKLLLFPRDVPSSKERRRSAIRDRSAEGRKRDLAPEDSSNASSYMDSEPISSWLLRSSRRVKSAPVALKKQKISEFPIAQPADDIINSNGALDIASSRVCFDQVSAVVALAPGLSHGLGDGTSVLENTSSLKDSSGPIVYYRRRRGGETCNESGCKDVIRSSATSFTSLLPIDESSWTWESFDVSGGLSDSEWPFWCLDGSQLLKFVIPGSTRLRVHPSFLVLSVRNFLLKMGDLWLLNTCYLLQHSAICTVWPNVQLEMLFVDNISGLRFFVFEGSLGQAVTFFFLVLEVFHRSHEKGKYYDLRTPVTIVTFRLALAQDHRKSLVFAFYSYSEVKDSEWMSLDFKLRRHCTLKKQLSVSECTYDNIKALESRSEGMLIASPDEVSFSSQAVEKTSKQDSICMGLYKGPACEGVNQFSGVKNPGPLPPFALSFSAAPTFFLGLHLKLLMGRAISHVHILNHDSIPWLSCDEKSPRSVPDVSSVEDCPKEIPVISVGSDRSRTCPRIQSETLVCSELELGNAPITSSSNGDLKNLRSMGNHKPGNACHGFQGPLHLKASATVQVYEQPSFILDGDQISSGALLAGDNFLRSKCNSGSPSSFNGISVEIPRFEPAENIGRGSRRTPRLPNVAWSKNDIVLDSPDRNTTKSMWQRSRHDTNSSHKLSSPVWPDGNAELYCNGFGSGPKKPRTQVSYTVPIGDIDFSSKQRNLHHRGMSHKRIRRASEKRSMDSSKSLHKQSELLICVANVLITHGDKGWREWGAQIALELDHNEWKLAVKHSGTTRYLYKAHQFLHPGSTNRHTHALMWKGGKDWSLEFSDRSQWTIFKEMHEECYNRNLRAVSVKNIPIPGVRLVEENDDNGLGVAFVRSSPRYIAQLESDIEMALNPLNILYDMDSDDEQWLLEHRDSFQIYDGEVEDSEELFEKSMDLLEKVAYTEKDDEFTHQEIEELFSGLGPMDTMKKVYDYWWQKRQRKGMPLIRQLQPPLWEIYEQQLKDWELRVSRKNSGFSNGSHEKFVPAEKPPMFAFCMKPRGLEIPNKGFKQRSHRRYSAAGKNHSVSGDHDVYHASGRRSNGSVWGDDYVVSPGNSHESSEFSPSLPTPRGVFSPRGASSKAYFSTNDLLERNHHPNLHRNKAKRMGMLPSSDPYSVSLYNRGTMPRSNGVQQSDMNLPEWPAYKNHQSEVTQRLLMEQLDSPDLDEFRLRDASGAAKHARNMARLKKEKAQRSLYRADLAIHKAIVALMNAEAIKASLEDPTTRDGTE